MPDIDLIRTYWCFLATRLDQARRAEHGMTTETVLITAGFAALALAVVAIIVAKVTEKANSIPTGP